MKKAIVIVVAVSLKQKALAFVTAQSSSPRFSFQQKHKQFSHKSSLSWRAEEASSSATNSAIILRGGASTLGYLASDDNGTVSRTSTTTLLASSSSSTSSSQISSGYYLVWSQGFLPKFAIAGAGFYGLHLLQWDARITGIISQKWKATRLAGATHNVVLPLLSSSCCLLQLFINVMVGAGGCAGFNTILGPVRPIFLALLVGLNVMTGASIRQSLWQYAFAMMPEGVHLWNELAKRRWHNRVVREEAKRQEAGDASGQTVASTKPRLRATILVDIPTMGCVACINKIDSSLRNCAPNQVVEASSWLGKNKKGGSARLDVFADSEEALQELSDTIVKTIDRAGFEGSVVTELQILPEEQ